MATFRKPKDPPAYTAVETPRQLRALASTLRQELVDLVQALGQASIPELAAQLQRPADALYYHVRALERAGLLVTVGSRQRGRHVEKLYSTPEPASRLKLRYRSGKPTATKPLRDLVASMLRGARRDFDRAIADPDCVLDGELRELWAGRAVGWVTPSELRRLNQLLEEAGALLSSARSPARNRMYALQFLLSPSDLPRRPAPPMKRGRKSIQT
ncbi:hypothetical protein GCM10011521_06260 [Arenimonas soli]|uniref:HTH arsR-type domain-containing protein n=1 Tax=Arenimonas soli TaxID=2269504 RepID=A0ABQ1HCR0_9GAMM|nr:helix-turn-helix domain-containing protein [Arenimonas soli]GGA70886.1 hypothetical protein GCM10011521_06260 [Arenimonas soli]